MLEADREKKIVLSLVVPMHNEAGNITAFYSRAKKVIDGVGVSYELICVNDGSTDDTLELLLALRKRDPNVKVISFARNFGKEAALTAGIDFSSGACVIPIDADLQDPPETIPALIAKWREGYDIVYATRRSREGESWFKRWTAHSFYRLANRVTNIEIPKDTGDFRLISRPAVESLKRLQERNRFMKGLFQWVGYKQTAVFYHRESRNAGKTAWNYWKLWNFAIDGITSFSSVPLQFATYIGLFIALLAFMYAIFIIVDTLVRGNPVPGYPSLLSVVLFLGGVQLFTIGVLGEYIGRIYSEVKRRPIYIVREAVGFDGPLEQGTSPTVRDL